MNPWIEYWANVFHALRGMSIILAIAGWLILFVYGIYVCAIDDSKKGRRVFLLILATTLVFTASSIFLPGYHTCKALLEFRQEVSK